MRTIDNFGQARQGLVRQEPQHARLHVHRAGARVVPRHRGLAQARRRHRRQGPGQVRLLLGILYRKCYLPNIKRSIVQIVKETNNVY